MRESLSLQFPSEYDCVHILTEGYKSCHSEELLYNSETELGSIYIMLRSKTQYRIQISGNKEVFLALTMLLSPHGEVLALCVDDYLDLGYMAHMKFKVTFFDNSHINFETLLTIYFHDSTIDFK